MRNASIRCTTAALLLLAGLLTPAAVRAEPGTQKSTAALAPLDLLSRLWGALTSLWGDAGCIIDPNGVCSARAGAVGQVDAGCILDPDGRCG